MSNNIQISSVGRLGFDPHLIRYGSIFLLIVGTFGNILSFIIFTHGTLRKSSTFFYLALLSLMDLLVLYSGLLDLLLTIEYGETYSLRNLNLVTCRLHTFITYWSQHSSSWILSFISVDRAVATNCLKFSKKFCTPRYAKHIAAILLFLIALVNSHELIFLRLQDTNVIENPDSYTTIRMNLSTQETFISYDINRNNSNLLKKRNIQSIFSFCNKSQWNFLCLRNKRDLINLNTTIKTVTLKPKISIKKCETLKNTTYGKFWDDIWEWIDVCLYALIPFTVMCIGSFFIVYRVYYQQRRVFRSRRSGARNPMGPSPNKAKSLFYLLFTLNLLYVILVSPVVFVTTILFRDSYEELAHPYIKTIVYLMQYSNHSLNFIFYGITAPPYRRTLYEWFDLLILHLPQCCQKKIRERSKSIQIQNNIQKQIHDNEQMKRLNNINSLNIQKESSSLIPR